MKYAAANLVELQKELFRPKLPWLECLLVQRMDIIIGRLSL